MNPYLIFIPLACFIGAALLFAAYALGAVASAADDRIERAMTDEMLETGVKSALLPQRSKVDAAWVAEQQKRKSDGERWVEMFDNWNESKDKR